MNHFNQLFNLYKLKDIKNKKVLLVYQSRYYRQMMNMDWFIRFFKNNNVYFIFGFHDSLKYGLNGYKYFDINDILKGKINVKFNYIIGNPPYQNSKTGKQMDSKKLWKKITEKCINLLSPDGFIYFITPVSVSTEKTKKSIIRPGIVSIQYNIQHHFKIGVNICSWIYSKKLEIDALARQNHKITIIDKNGNTRDVNYNELFLENEEDTKELMFFTNLAKNKKRLFKNGSPSKTTDPSEPDNIHQYKIIGNDTNEKNSWVRYVKDKPDDLNKMKIVIKRTRDISEDNIRITKDTFGDTYSYIVVEGKTNKEIKKIIEFITDKRIIKISESSKKYNAGINEFIRLMPYTDSFDVDTYIQSLTKYKIPSQFC